MSRALVPLLAAAALLVGCGGGDDPAAKVGIKTFQFMPDPVAVKAGEKVVFTNFDATVHTVTGPGFDHRLDQNGTAEVTFEEAGTVAYRCTLHSGPGMKGDVMVR